MPFAYYQKLSTRQQSVYRRSDEIHNIVIPDCPSLLPFIPLLSAALKEENRKQAQTLCQKLSDQITTRLKVPPVRIKVYTKRPHISGGELHGLYEPNEGNEPPLISIWMRTAQRGQVVAFKTFLRTLLHELCHHFDYELFRLPETFHTEGFYKRESSLLQQLLEETKSTLEK